MWTLLVCTSKHNNQIPKKTTRKIHSVYCNLLTTFLFSLFRANRYFGIKNDIRNEFSRQRRNLWVLNNIFFSHAAQWVIQSQRFNVATIVCHFGKMSWKSLIISRNQRFFRLFDKLPADDLWRLFVSTVFHCHSLFCSVEPPKEKINEMKFVVSFVYVRIFVRT